MALVQGNLGLRQKGDLWKGTIIKVESVGFFLYDHGQGNLGLRQNDDLWEGTIIKVESVGFFLMRGKTSGMSSTGPAGRTS